MTQSQLVHYHMYVEINKQLYSVYSIINTGTNETEIMAICSDDEQGGGELIPSSWLQVDLAQTILEIVESGSLFEQDLTDILNEIDALFSDDFLRDERL